MRYPIARCNKNIVVALSAELKKHSRLYRVPSVLNVVSATEFSYYMKGIRDKVGFVSEVDLKGKNLSKHQWGSWHGDYRAPIAGIVNSDNIMRPLPQGLSVVKCYVDYHNHFCIGEALFHPSDMPAPIVSVELTKRERNIMFVFGALKDRLEKEMALSRLGVKPTEIETLLKKQAIKPSSKGYVLTLAGAAARLDVPQIDLW